MSWLWAIPLAAALICVLLFAAVCACAHRRRELHPVDCILVLGAKIHPDGSMSRTLRWRCERARELWRDGIAAEIVVCGGRCGAEPCSEAQVMADCLAELGVPRAHIHLENASVNTWENLRNAALIMAAHGWKRASIVTSDYHLQRALWMARDLGMQACGAGAKSNPRPIRRIKARSRECVSWILYFRHKILQKSRD